MPPDVARILRAVDWRVYGIESGEPTTRQVDQVRLWLEEARIAAARAAWQACRQGAPVPPHFSDPAT